MINRHYQLEQKFVIMRRNLQSYIDLTLERLSRIQPASK